MKFHGRIFSLLNWPFFCPRTLGGPSARVFEVFLHLSKSASGAARGAFFLVADYLVAVGSGASAFALVSGGACYGPI